MNTHADKTQESKSQLHANEVSQKQSGRESTFQFVDNRPEAVAQRKLQEMVNNSSRIAQLRSFQDMADNSPQAKQAAQLQTMADNYTAQQQQPIQKKENKTGLLDNLKTGMENLSGMSLDDVKVHRNSDKPAQLHAHAYAQGTDIHIASGQEKYLPHEAWHIVQQKQGRVKPTMQMKKSQFGNGEPVQINDEPGLEKEADVVGAKAMGNGSRLLQTKSVSFPAHPGRISSLQRKMLQTRVVQMAPRELTEEERAKLEEHSNFLDHISDVLSHSASIPPLLSEKFFEEFEIAEELVNECLDTNACYGGKALSVIDWRMEVLENLLNEAKGKAAIERASNVPVVAEESEEQLIPLERNKHDDFWGQPPKPNKLESKKKRAEKQKRQAAKKGKRLIIVSAAAAAIPVPPLDFIVTGNPSVSGARKHYNDGWAAACEINGDNDLTKAVRNDIENQYRNRNQPVGKQEILFSDKTVGTMTKGCNILYKITRLTNGNLRIVILHCGPAKSASGSGY